MIAAESVTVNLLAVQMPSRRYLSEVFRSMEVKWVCEECGSVNREEESPRMVCFVCEHVRTTEPLLDVHDSAESHPAKWKKISLPMIKKSSFPIRKREKYRKEPSPGRTPVDWMISSSPPDSKEAYVAAAPVYAEESRPPVPPKKSEKPAAALKVRERAEEASFLPPWPEHRIRYNLDRLTASGCMAVHPEERDGTKGYHLTFSGGKERFLTVTNMRLLGYAAYR